MVDEEKRKGRNELDKEIQEKLEKVDYEKYKNELSTQELKVRIDDVYAVETRLAILMAIGSFGSANIKRLAKLLGKNDATILHHLKHLLDENRGPRMLEIDTQMTMKLTGKYYKLTEVAERIFGEPPSEILEKKMIPTFEAIIEKSDTEINEILGKMRVNHPESEKQADIERKRLSYNHLFEGMMVGNLEKAQQAFAAGKKPKNKNYPIGTISNYEVSLKASKTRHLFEVMKLLTNFSVDFGKLKSKIKKEMDKENIPEEDRILLRYHIVGGEIGEFEFE